MKTHLIIHRRWRDLTNETVDSFDLGVLTGSEAKVAALKLAASNGVKAEDLCHTPKIVGGARFYIGVVR